MSKHFIILFVFLAGVLFAIFGLHNYLLAFGILFLYLTVLFFGVYVFQLNYFFPAQHRINPSKNAVVLTFDDGPQPPHTEKVLAILKEKKVQAIFFFIGKNAEVNPEMVQKTQQDGHKIGHHSYSHSKLFPALSTKRVTEDILQGAEAVAKIANAESRLFRPPFGLTNPNIARAIKRCNVLPIGWSLRSYDTMIDSKEKLVNRVLSRVKAGDIILLHDWGKHTAEALPEIIDGIRAKDLEFTVELTTKN